jgi:hypothetical protein
MGKFVKGYIFISKKVIFTIIVIFTSILCLSACSGIAEKDEKTFENFNFIFFFGFAVETKQANCINTYEGIFTKDLIQSGTETIDFNIPEDKMKEIYDAFLEYNISDLPDDVSGESMTRPAYTFIFTYTWGSEKRTIVCNEADFHTRGKNPDTHKRLVKFADMIVEYIYSTEEYKNMSPATGGYA